MSRALAVDLFVEDHAHEEFLRALVNRLARQESKPVQLQVRSARGGHPRALSELRLLQRAILAGAVRAPDGIIVAIDANCMRFGAARTAIAAELDARLAPVTAIACPDPHIERWYLADPDSFAVVVGVRPNPGRRKCERDRYKRILAGAILKAGFPATLGGEELAGDIVDEMDLYRAGKSEPSLKHFLDDVTTLLRRL